MIMNLVAYLRENGLESLENEHYISTSRHTDYPQLVSFKYSQLKSKFDKLVPRECRGTILDEEDNWKIIALPYTKFFNYGETNADSIDWNGPISVTEKFDGSLVTLYYYDDKWHVSTLGHPSAGGGVVSIRGKDKEERLKQLEKSEKQLTYADVFWRIFHSEQYKHPSNDKHMCFMFELMTPVSGHVIKAKSEELLLHGARNLLTLEEVEPEIYSTKYNWKLVKKLECQNKEEIVAMSKQLSAEHEGFVLRDRFFKRIKIKSPLYVKMHLIRSKNKPAERLLSIVQSNEGSEFLAYFPEYTETYYKLYKKYKLLLEYTSSQYNRMKSISDQKSFALECKKLRNKSLSAVLFRLRKEKDTHVSLEEIFAEMNLYSFISCLDMMGIDAGDTTNDKPALSVGSHIEVRNKRKKSNDDDNDNNNNDVS